MSLSVPTREQLLYGQLAIVDSLIEYIIDNMDHSVFEDKQLYVYMDEASLCVNNARICMRNLLTKEQDERV